jgi:carbon-monoxide dehydrogenase large subunit
MRQRHKAASESEPSSRTTAPEGLAPGTFVGTGIERREDAPLITGQSSYLDDVQYPGMVHLALVRSQHASAEIASIDATDALDREGVLAVYTHEDLVATGVEEGMATDSPDRGVSPEFPVLARERVRYQGQPIAAVVATDRYLAYDAVEAVGVSYERDEAVTDPARALEPESPAVHGVAPDNVAFEWEAGDEAATDEAFANADRTVDLQLVNNRLMPVAMATQAAVARYRSSAGELLVDVGSQKPHGTRSTLSRILGLPEHRIEVTVPDVGGGFGGKLRLYPGHILTGWAAMQLDRPVKWTATRVGDSVDTSHSRHQLVDAEAALDADGSITAVRAQIHANVGGYLVPGGSGVPSNTGRMICGQYDIPAAHVELTGVFTNTTPLSAYRGAGRPEAAYVIERLVSAVAREVGADPVAFRRRNMLEPEQFPHETPTGYTYDSGDYEASLDRALELIDYDQLRDRQARLRMEGRYLGIGVSCYTDKGGGHSSDYESGLVRITPTGKVVAGTGTMDTGQGHRTSYAQIVADELGVPYEDVEIVEGDTERTPEGRGTGGSRSVPMAGNALRAGARKVVEKGRLVAANRFEVDPEAVRFEDGVYSVDEATASGFDPGAASDEHPVDIQTLAADAYAGSDTLGDLEPGLEETAFFAPTDRTFPFGTHLAVVEVDPETGDVEFERYVAVDDCGVQINPTLVEGQIVGGIAQGVGQALTEGVAYDDSGTLITGTLQDYAVPKAHHVPEIETDSTVTPSPNNPLGVKGVGESGTTGAPPAIVNAVVDALRPFGVDNLDMPLTSESIWRAVQD